MPITFPQRPCVGVVPEPHAGCRSHRTGRRRRLVGAAVYGKGPVIMCNQPRRFVLVLESMHPVSYVDANGLAPPSTVSAHCSCRPSFLLVCLVAEMRAR